MHPDIHGCHPWMKDILVKINKDAGYQLCENEKIQRMKDGPWAISKDILHPWMPSVVHPTAVCELAGKGPVI